ncbi:MAG: SDR family NAD(P)-dependent oxidoreductase, partial [Clostridium sp.]|nr:SDR family NAD(P)-dependent oxidoreductase [Clostridium sp.]
MKTLNTKKILVTGAAGFIGYFLCQRLLDMGSTVVGIDNLNDYYDVSLKHERLHLLEPYKKFSFHKIDISDRAAIEKLVSNENFNIVVNLAAQAGVRY